MDFIDKLGTTKSNKTLSVLFTNDIYMIFGDLVTIHYEGSGLYCNTGMEKLTN